MSNRALFLDRDGVINLNHGYVHKPDNFDFIDGIFALVKEANAAGYMIIVITNQAGIARGYYTENDFLKLSEWMSLQFELQGAKITKVYFSPYHPTEGIGKYKRDDISRKPRPGMIFEAQKEFNISLAESILIGDQATDILAGIEAGVGTNILFSTQHFDTLNTSKFIPVSHLNQVISLLVNKERAISTT
ncbi:D-glycero-alpha-D-manno-heptose-1,7-bisphosphate 7-phosphatase [Methylophilus methylotrophus]|uniref:D-glycero-alpha-D-manno-heptose-1,7-bisphosphate 7-phosphatase n=1 Tax=Methylophilus methylotrophus TaxID=17 RepID=UPI000F5B5951|nr:HAD family hydrolase [Methylophilus methylotrophus]